MGKKIITILFLLLLIHAVQAQNKYQYVDSGLLGLVPVDSITPNDILYEDEEDKEELITYNEEEEDIIADTIIHYREVPFSLDSFNTWRNNKDYAYAKNLDSLLKAKEKEMEKSNTNWVSRNETKSVSIFSEKIAQIILWSFAAIFVAFVLYKLFSIKGLFKVGQKKSNVTVDDQPEVELDFNQNFDQLIHNAYKLGDYKLGVRYLFLKTIKILSDKQFITLSAEKTNARYLQEMPLQFKKDFSNIIKQYEYVWYGNFKLDKEIFSNIESTFNGFVKKV